MQKQKSIIEAREVTTAAYIPFTFVMLTWNIQLYSPHTPQ